MERIPLCFKTSFSQSEVSSMKGQLEELTDMLPHLLDFHQLNPKFDFPTLLHSTFNLKNAIKFSIFQHTYTTSYELRMIILKLDAVIISTEGSEQIKFNEYIQSIRRIQSKLISIIEQNYHQFETESIG